MIDPQEPDYSNTPANPNRPTYGYRLLDAAVQPAVSIVTPFYNTGKIFHETAKSILSQSLQQWEWIIVNDGSTDPESMKLLDSYRKLDMRIRIIDHSENLGCPTARNTGILHARNKFCLLIDSDDLLEPTAAEKWFWFLEGHPQYAFVHGYSVGFGGLNYLWQSGFRDVEANLESNRIPLVAMLRKDVHQEVGGFNEEMRSGLEDWDFWLRSADHGYWGFTIPEYLYWYRTRDSHADRWENLREDRLKDMQKEFRKRYPRLWGGGFPKIQPKIDLDFMRLTEELPCENKLHKDKRRLLVVANWMVVGGAEKFNLDLIRQLIERGWEVTLATTSVSENPWMHAFEQLTPDVFPMNTFLDWNDYPRFLHYLIQSRGIDALLVAASQEVYRLLPYLRFHFPHLPIIDFLHLVTPDWMDGGYPRLSLTFQSAIDLTIVSSKYLKGWMLSEGAEPERVRVATTNIDTDYWRPDPTVRSMVRSKLGLDDEQTIILYVARLEQQKQPDVFAKTMLRLSKMGLPFTALVVGDGSLKDWLEDFLRENNLRSKVQILGELAASKVRGLMMAGDIIFLPSANEGISLTLYEGMACGLVPVGADVGGQRELVVTGCGILMSIDEMEQQVEQYANVLRDLIRDPEMRQRMGQACRERISQNFRLDQMGDQMMTLIQEAEEFRQVKPRTPTDEELYLALARASIEYTRTRAEFKRIQAQLENMDMPPAPARTYFYFAIRQLLYPIYSRFGGGKNVRAGILKNKIKSLLVDNPEVDAR